MLDFNRLSVHCSRKVGDWEGVLQCRSQERDVAANKGSYTGTKTVALFSFQNKTPFFICLLLIYGVWKGMVVGEQFSFCSVERLGGSLELAPSVTSRTDLVLALPCVIG